MDTEERSADDLVLDGNAVAGALFEVFGGDVTNAHGECARCGHGGELGRLVAFTRGPGIVLRCPACGEVMVRIVETPRGTVVDLRGAAHLRLPRSPSARR